MNYMEKEERINEMVTRVLELRAKNYALHHKIEYMTREIEKCLEELLEH